MSRAGTAVLTLCAACTLPSAALAAQAPAPPAAARPAFTAVEMMRLARMADLQLSPDGTLAVFALTRIDLEAGKRDTDLWAAPLAGGPARPLVEGASADSRPRFSRDGRRLAFLSNRDGSPQVWVADAQGQGARRVTALATGVDGFEWIDQGRVLVQTQVFPDCGADDACNSRRLAAAARGSSARAYDELLYRHWDTWSDGRRSHLLALAVDGGDGVDLTPGAADAPPFSLGDADWAVSADGSEACFSRKDPRDEAWSTNADVFVVPTSGGEPRRVSSAAGYDGSCAFSPDGRLLAWRSQQRAGYESDRWQLVVRDRQGGGERRLTAGLDRSVESFAFSPDSRTVFFVVEENARSRVLAVPVEGGAVRTVADGGTLAELRVLPDGRSILASEASLTHPAEVVRFGTEGGRVERVTHLNDALLDRFGLREGESVSYDGAAGRRVQAWLVKPPGFDPARRYPLLVLVHGGPQGAWTDGWTYRWNAQVFAGAGYLVLMPNPRGSVGWGQAFTDDVNRDWGGRAFEDVMKGTDWAEALPYVAKGRTSAAGASYGGYMVNWIAGHSDRFRALVSHDGVFDLVSMYGSTEELWFPEWELGGPYWKSPDIYQRWNPRSFVTGFKTPTLVVHGERDYRVPLEQGLAMFTALRRQGVPARLLVFPDENHWVLKPANSVRWYEEVLGWLDRWTRD